MNAGINDKNIRNGLIVLLAVLAVTGAMSAVEFIQKQFGGQQDKVAQIQANNNVFINIGAEAYNTTPEKIQSAIAHAIETHGRKKVAKEARKILSPAKLESDTEMRFFSDTVAAESPVLTFNKELINALPSYDFSEGDVQIPESNTEVRITSMDIERYRAGWAAHIPAVSSKRIPIIFNGDANLEQIAIDRNYIANITVIYTRDKDSGNLKPKRAIIDKLVRKIDKLKIAKEEA